jgi:hypothetical protein
MATYTMHTNVPLDVTYGPWTGRGGHAGRPLSLIPE